VASPDSRIRNLIEQTGASHEEAANRVRTVDRERRRFVEKYLHRDIDDATAYDLVLNTDRLDRDHCVFLIQETYGKVLARLALEVNTPADHVV
jgi:cytidylate kinase